MTVSDTGPSQPDHMTVSRILMPDVDIQSAARRLVTLFGPSAEVEAAEYAARLARQARWREHDAAMRILTVVENLAKGAKT